MKVKDLFESNKRNALDIFVAEIKRKYKNNFMHLINDSNKTLYRGIGKNYNFTKVDKCLSYSTGTSRLKRNSLTRYNYINLIQ